MNIRRIFVGKFFVTWRWALNAAFVQSLISLQVLKRLWSLLVQFGPSLHTLCISDNIGLVVFVHQYKRDLKAARFRGHSDCSLTERSIKMRPIFPIFCLFSKLVCAQVRSNVKVTGTTVGPGYHRSQGKGETCKSKCKSYSLFPTKNFSNFTDLYLVGIRSLSML